MVWILHAVATRVTLEVPEAAGALLNFSRLSVQELSVSLIPVGRVRGISQIVNKRRMLRV